MVVTKSHCCDSQILAHGFIGNTVVTMRGTVANLFHSRSQCTCTCLIQNNHDKCVSCDISQEPLKNLGTAVKIVSVYTDLHSHEIQTRVSTKFPGHCLQSELWFKFCVKRVLLTQMKYQLVQFPEMYMFLISFGNILHDTYNAAVNFEMTQLSSYTKTYNPRGFNKCLLT